MNGLAARSTTKLLRAKLRRPSARTATTRIAPPLAALSPASSQPLVYLVEDFLSGAECDHLEGVFWGLWGEHADPDGIDMMAFPPLGAPDPVARDIEERVGQLMHSPPHLLDGGVKIERKAFTSHIEQAAAGGSQASNFVAHAPDGVHLDTHKEPMRWGTCLIYLSSLTEGMGGETVFPLGGPSPPDTRVLHAAQELTNARCYHTDLAATTTEHLEPRAPNPDPLSDSELAAAAQVLVAAGEQAAKGECGLRLRPRRGTAAVFYTRQPDASLDPRAWHFGAPVLSSSQVKWTVQIFKALPADAQRCDREQEAFMRRVHPAL